MGFERKGAKYGRHGHYDASLTAVNWITEYRLADTFEVHKYLVWRNPTIILVLT